MNYYEGIKEETSKLKNLIINSDLPLLIISRKSKEGFCASSIIVKTLQRLNKNFSLSFFDNIESRVKELSINQNKKIIIIDPKEEDIKNLEKIKDKEIIILEKSNYSVSEKAYVVAKDIDLKNTDLAYISLLSLVNVNNNYLLLESEESKKIKQVKGIKIIGSNTRPIHKAIEVSIEPFVIGVSGYEENTLNMLKELDIKIKSNDYWFSLQDLNEQQIEKIINSLSLNVYSKKEIFGNIIILNDEERNSPLKDVKEFSLFLEACIKYNKPSIAIAKCLLSNNYKNKSIDILREYRQEIIKTLSLFYTRSEADIVVEKENCLIINFKNLIAEEVIEKTIELIQNSKLYPQKKRVIGLCQTKSDKVKCIISMYNSQTDQNTKNFINSLPEGMLHEYKECNALLVQTNQENEGKLIELVLEHLESTRIEEVNK